MATPSQGQIWAYGPGMLRFPHPSAQVILQMANVLLLLADAQGYYGYHSNRRGCTKSGLVIVSGDETPTSEMVRRFLHSREQVIVVAASSRRDHRHASTFGN
jgi:hypothetical protein